MRQQAPHQMPPSQSQPPPSTELPQLGQNVASVLRVIVTPTSDIRVNNCGNHVWFVDFSLTASTATDGWIIQELETEDVDSGTGEVLTEHLWEAWPVPAGANRTPREQGAQGNDQYLATGPARRGRRTMSGTLRYYPLSMMPGATSTTIPGFAPGQMGQLQTTSQPGFWTGSGGTPHRLNVTWDCRPGHTRRPVVQSTPRARVRDWPAPGTGTSRPPRPTH